MEAVDTFEINDLEARAGEAALMLKLLANERRLLILCQLVGGETSVGTLAQAVGLGQSALSQHLAKMREEGLVATRRESQTVFYRINDPRVTHLLKTMKEIFCP